MASRGDLLFELAIGKEGNIVVTQPAPKVYLVTFTSPPDNRLVTVCDTLRTEARECTLTWHRSHSAKPSS